MESLIKLSVCITVFNQIDIVRQNIENLLQYKGDNVEFIISDDHSTEDIEGLVKSFHDDRLFYFRTSYNVGHDLNILNAIECARGEFVLILRSRDTVIVNKLSQVIDVLYSGKDIAYAVFSAVNENGSSKLIFKDKIYTSGINGIRLHTKLFVHPSGNIYRKKYLNTAILREHIKRSFNHKFGFTVHDLIRMELVCKGNSLTSSLVAWIYTDSAKQKDIAVNSVGKGKSVYDPTISYERCECEFYYVNHVLEAEDKYKYLLNKFIILSYYKRITYDFAFINKNKEMQSHYNYREIPFNARHERKKFRSFIFCLLKNQNVFKSKFLYLYVWLYTLKLIFYYPMRDFLLCNFLTDKQILKLSNRMKRL